MDKIGIVVAMQEEREAIEKILENVEVEQVCNLRIIKGKIKNKECILVECGVGKVNAARATQVIIDKFEVDTIINVGVAGAVNPMLEIGDIVIGKYVLQHDFDITAFGHSKGYITGVGDRINCTDKYDEQVEKIIDESIEKNYQVKLGIVATGDIFCTDIDMKNKIQAKFDADVVDMECAAIGQVAYLNDIPFAVIRSVSDTPNGKNAKTFDENLKLASKRSADMLEEMLEEQEEV